MNSPLMESYNEEVRSEEARHWNFIQYVCLGAPLVSVGIFSLIFYTEIEPRSERLVFGVSLCAIAAILAGTYYYTYKFFTDDKFYFFIFTSWVANAIYLIPEWINPPPVSPSYQTGVFILSLISTVFLLLAFHFRGEKVPDRQRLIVGVVIGAVLLFFDILQIYYNLGSNDKPQAYWILAGSFFAFLLIWSVGETLIAHLNSIIYGRNLKPVLYTFYLYGLLQFIYPFKPYLEKNQLHWLPTIFVIAQLAKVGNAISIMGVLQAASAYRDIKRNEEAREAEHKLSLEKLELEAQESRLLADKEKIQRENQYVQLGMLTASIKHDVNTPLATLSFAVGAVKEKYQHDNWVIRKMESMEESMRRIYATVKVVDYFQGDKAYYNRDKLMSKASMLEIVHRAIRSVKNEREELKQSNARIKIKVNGREAWVRANVPMLEQVVVNVIKNGIEAIDEAGRESGLININIGTTKLTGNEYPRWVKVEVADNGCGIPEENIEKLTTLFTTRNDKKPNSGIGLFIGKKILDIHDSDIKFQSTEGEGTRVTLLLPEWFALQKHRAGMHPDEIATVNDFELSGEGNNDVIDEELESATASPDVLEETPANSGDNI